MSNTSGYGKSTMRLLGVTSYLALAATAVFANPVDPNVIAGNVNVGGLGTNNVIIDNNAMRSIVNWGGFSIGAGEVTTINQLNGNAAILNRVVGENPSEIYGQLNSNGQVWLINQHGILVGKDGVIDTNGFIASTLDVSDSDFLGAGEATFRENPAGAGGITVLGTIKSVSGGDIFLLSREIEIGETGKIHTAGYVGLGAGQEILLRPTDSGDGRISIRAGKGSITNRGSIRAAVAELRAAGGNEYALAINNTGVIRATGVKHVGGRVLLTAGGAVSNTGTIHATRKVIIHSTQKITNTGVIRAANKKQGGTVVLDAPEINIGAPSLIDVSAALGGGRIYVGGGKQGGAITDTDGETIVSTNATKVTVDAGAILNASSTQSGNAGDVVIWSDGSTSFAGTITAQATGTSGNGGNVEVSGKQSLAFTGGVNTTAAYGSTGTLLLDPDTVTITGAASISQGSDDSSTYLPAPSSTAALTLSDATLSTLLTNNNVTVTGAAVGISGAVGGTHVIWTNGPGTDGTKLEIDAAAISVDATLGEVIIQNFQQSQSAAYLATHQTTVNDFIQEHDGVVFKAPLISIGNNLTQFYRIAIGSEFGNTVIGDGTGIVTIQSGQVDGSSTQIGLDLRVLAQYRHDANGNPVRGDDYQLYHSTNDKSDPAYYSQVWVEHAHNGDITVQGTAVTLTAGAGQLDAQAYKLGNFVQIGHGGNANIGGVTIVADSSVKIQATNQSGSLAYEVKTDSSNNPVLQQKTDSSGNPLYYAVDGGGNKLYQQTSDGSSTGTKLYQAQTAGGQLLYQQTSDGTASGTPLYQAKDSSGNLLVQAKNASGQPLYQTSSSDTTPTTNSTSGIPVTTTAGASDATTTAVAATSANGLTASTTAMTTTDNTGVQIVATSSNGLTASTTAATTSTNTGVYAETTTITSGKEIYTTTPVYDTSKPIYVTDKYLSSATSLSYDAFGNPNYDQTGNIQTGYSVTDASYSGTVNTNTYAILDANINVNATAALTLTTGGNIPGMSGERAYVQIGHGVDNYLDNTSDNTTTAGFYQDGAIANGANGIKQGDMSGDINIKAGSVMVGLAAAYSPPVATANPYATRIGEQVDEVRIGSGGHATYKGVALPDANAVEIATGRISGSINIDTGVLSVGGIEVLATVPGGTNAPVQEIVRNDQIGHGATVKVIVSDNGTQTSNGVIETNIGAIGNFITINGSYRNVIDFNNPFYQLTQLSDNPADAAYTGNSSGNLAATVYYTIDYTLNADGTISRVITAHDGLPTGQSLYDGNGKLNTGLISYYDGNATLTQTLTDGSTKTVQLNGLLRSFVGTVVNSKSGSTAATGYTFTDGSYQLQSGDMTLDHNGNPIILLPIDNAVTQSANNATNSSDITKWFDPALITAGTDWATNYRAYMPVTSSTSGNNGSYSQSDYGSGSTTGNIVSFNDGSNSSADRSTTIGRGYDSRTSNTYVNTGEIQVQDKPNTDTASGTTISSTVTDTSNNTTVSNTTAKTLYGFQMLDDGGTGSKTTVSAWSLTAPRNASGNAGSDASQQYIANADGYNLNAVYADGLLTERYNTHATNSPDINIKAGVTTIQQGVTAANMVPGAVAQYQYATIGNGNYVRSTVDHDLLGVATTNATVKAVAGNEDAANDRNTSTRGDIAVKEGLISGRINLDLAALTVTALANAGSMSALSSVELYARVGHGSVFDLRGASGNGGGTSLHPARAADITVTSADIIGGALTVNSGAVAVTSTGNMGSQSLIQDTFTTATIGHGATARITTGIGGAGTGNYGSGTDQSTASARGGDITFNRGAIGDGMVLVDEGVNNPGDLSGGGAVVGGQLVNSGTAAGQQVWQSWNADGTVSYAKNVVTGGALETTGLRSYGKSDVTLAAPVSEIASGGISQDIAVSTVPANALPTIYTSDIWVNSAAAVSVLSTVIQGSQGAAFANKAMARIGDENYYEFTTGNGGSDGAAASGGRGGDIMITQVTSERDLDGDFHRKHNQAETNDGTAVTDATGYDNGFAYEDIANGTKSNVHVSTTLFSVISNTTAGFQGTASYNTAQSTIGNGDDMWLTTGNGGAGGAGNQSGINVLHASQGGAGGNINVLLDGAETQGNVVVDGAGSDALPFGMVSKTDSHGKVTIYDASGNAITTNYSGAATVLSEVVEGQQAISNFNQTETVIGHTARVVAYAGKGGAGGTSNSANVRGGDGGSIYVGMPMVDNRLDDKAAYDQLGLTYDDLYSHLGTSDVVMKVGATLVNAARTSGSNLTSPVEGISDNIYSGIGSRNRVVAVAGVGGDGGSASTSFGSGYQPDASGGNGGDAIEVSGAVRSHIYYDGGALMVSNSLTQSPANGGDGGYTQVVAQIGQNQDIYTSAALAGNGGNLTAGSDAGGIADAATSDSGSVKGLDGTTKSTLTVKIIATNGDGSLNRGGTDNGIDISGTGADGGTINAKGGAWTVADLAAVGTVAVVKDSNGNAVLDTVSGKTYQEVTLANDKFILYDKDGNPEFKWDSTLNDSVGGWIDNRYDAISNPNGTFHANTDNNTNYNNVLGADINRDGKIDVITFRGASALDGTTTYTITNTSTHAVRTSNTLNLQADEVVTATAVSNYNSGNSYTSARIDVVDVNGNGTYDQLAGRSQYTNNSTTNVAYAGASNTAARQGILDYEVVSTRTQVTPYVAGTARTDNWSGSTEVVVASTNSGHQAFSGDVNGGYQLQVNTPDSTDTVLTSGDFSRSNGGRGGDAVISTGYTMGLIDIAAGLVTVQSYINDIPSGLGNPAGQVGLPNDRYTSRIGNGGTYLADTDNTAIASSWQAGREFGPLLKVALSQMTADTAAMVAAAVPVAADNAAVAADNAAIDADNAAITSAQAKLDDNDPSNDAQAAQDKSDAQAALSTHQTKLSTDKTQLNTDSGALSTAQHQLAGDFDLAPIAPKVANGGQGGTNAVVSVGGRAGDSLIVLGSNRPVTTAGYNADIGPVAYEWDDLTGAITINAGAVLVDSQVNNSLGGNINTAAIGHGDQIFANANGAKNIPIITTPGLASTMLSPWRAGSMAAGFAPLGNVGGSGNAAGGASTITEIASAGRGGNATVDEGNVKGVITINADGVIVNALRGQLSIWPTFPTPSFDDTVLAQIGHGSYATALAGNGGGGTNATEIGAGIGAFVPGNAGDARMEGSGGAGGNATVSLGNVIDSAININTAGLAVTTAIWEWQNQIGRAQIGSGDIAFATAGFGGVASTAATASVHNNQYGYHLDDLTDSAHATYSVVSASGGKKAIGANDKAKVLIRAVEAIKKANAGVYLEASPNDGATSAVADGQIGGTFNGGKGGNATVETGLINSAISIDATGLVAVTSDVGQVMGGTQIYTSLDDHVLAAIGDGSYGVAVGGAGGTGGAEAGKNVSVNGGAGGTTTVALGNIGQYIDADRASFANYVDGVASNTGAPISIMAGSVTVTADNGQQDASTADPLETANRSDVAVIGHNQFSYADATYAKGGDAGQGSGVGHADGGAGGSAIATDGTVLGDITIGQFIAGAYDPVTGEYVEGHYANGTPTTVLVTALEDQAWNLGRAEARIGTYRQAEARAGLNDTATLNQAVGGKGGNAKDYAISEYDNYDITNKQWYGVGFGAGTLDDASDIGTVQPGQPVWYAINQRGTAYGGAGGSAVVTLGEVDSDISVYATASDTVMAIVSVPPSNLAAIPLQSLVEAGIGDRDRTKAVAANGGAGGTANTAPDGFVTGTTGTNTLPLGLAVDASGAAIKESLDALYAKGGDGGAATVNSGAQVGTITVHAPVVAVTATQTAAALGNGLDIVAQIGHSNENLLTLAGNGGDGKRGGDGGTATLVQGGFGGDVNVVADTSLTVTAASVSLAADASSRTSAFIGDREEAGNDLTIASATGAVNSLYWAGGVFGGGAGTGGNGGSVVVDQGGTVTRSIINGGTTVVDAQTNDINLRSLGTLLVTSETTGLGDAGTATTQVGHDVRVVKAMAQSGAASGLAGNAAYVKEDGTEVLSAKGGDVTVSQRDINASITLRSTGDNAVTSVGALGLITATTIVGNYTTVEMAQAGNGAGIVTTLANTTASNTISSSTTEPANGGDGANVADSGDGGSMVFNLGAIGPSLSSAVANSAGAILIQSDSGNVSVTSNAAVGLATISTLIGSQRELGSTLNAVTSGTGGSLGGDGGNITVFRGDMSGAVTLVTFQGNSTTVSSNAALGAAITKVGDREYLNVLAGNGGAANDLSGSLTGVLNTLIGDTASNTNTSLDDARAAIRAMESTLAALKAAKLKADQAGDGNAAAIQAQINAVTTAISNAQGALAAVSNSNALPDSNNTSDATANAKANAVTAAIQTVQASATTVKAAITAVAALPEGVYDPGKGGDITYTGTAVYTASGNVAGSKALSGTLATATDASNGGLVNAKVNLYATASTSESGILDPNNILLDTTLDPAGNSIAGQKVVATTGAPVQDTTITTQNPGAYPLNSNSTNTKTPDKTVRYTNASFDPLTGKLQYVTLPVQLATYSDTYNGGTAVIDPNYQSGSTPVADSASTTMANPNPASLLNSTATNAAAAVGLAPAKTGHVVVTSINAGALTTTQVGTERVAINKSGSGDSKVGAGGDISISNTTSGGVAAVGGDVTISTDLAATARIGDVVSVTNTAGTGGTGTVKTDGKVASANAIGSYGTAPVADYSTDTSVSAEQDPTAYKPVASNSDILIFAQTGDVKAAASAGGMVQIGHSSVSSQNGGTESAVNNSQTIANAINVKSKGATALTSLAGSLQVGDTINETGNLISDARGSTPHGSGSTETQTISSPINFDVATSLLVDGSAGTLQVGHSSPATIIGSPSTVNGLLALTTTLPIGLGTPGTPAPVDNVSNAAWHGASAQTQTVGGDITINVNVKAVNTGTPGLLTHVAQGKADGADAGTAAGDTLITGAGARIGSTFTPNSENGVQTVDNSVWLATGADLKVSNAAIGPGAYDTGSKAVSSDNSTNGTTRNRLVGNTTIGAAQNTPAFNQDGKVAGAMTFDGATITSGYKGAGAKGQLRFFTPSRENVVLTGNNVFNDSASTSDAVVPRASSNLYILTGDGGAQHENGFQKMSTLASYNAIGDGNFAFYFDQPVSGNPGYTPYINWFDMDDGFSVTWNDEGNDAEGSVNSGTLNNSNYIGTSSDDLNCDDQRLTADEKEKCTTHYHSFGQGFGSNSNFSGSAGGNNGIFNNFRDDAGVTNTEAILAPDYIVPSAYSAPYKVSVAPMAGFTGTTTQEALIGPLAGDTEAGVAARNAGLGFQSQSNLLPLESIGQSVVATYTANSAVEINQMRQIYPWVLAYASTYGKAKQGL